MQPLAIDLQLLRSLLVPEMRILPGRALMARVVVADANGRGTISIAGYLLDAELPKSVRTGQELRLVVRDVSPDRVLLGLTHDQEQSAPSTAVALPGGGSIAVTERDGDGGGQSAPGSHALTLRYDAPALGAVDLRFELDPASLRVNVAVSSSALAQSQASAQGLLEALAGAVGQAVSVTVSARREPLEIYA
ncbi:MAG: hypothetical protein ACLP50_28895 [Solirubrobacteraceae bacterium]